MRLYLVSEAGTFAESLDREWMHHIWTRCIEWNTKNHWFSFEKQNHRYTLYTYCKCEQTCSKCIFHCKCWDFCDCSLNILFYFLPYSSSSSTTSSFGFFSFHLLCSSIGRSFWCFVFIYLCFCYLFVRYVEILCSKIIHIHIYYAILMCHSTRFTIQQYTRTHPFHFQFSRVCYIDGRIQAVIFGTHTYTHPEFCNSIFVRHCTRSPN